MTQYLQWSASKKVEHGLVVWLTQILKLKLKRQKLSRITRGGVSADANRIQNYTTLLAGKIIAGQPQQRNLVSSISLRMGAENESAKSRNTRKTTCYVNKQTQATPCPFNTLYGAKVLNCSTLEEVR